MSAHYRLFRLGLMQLLLVAVLTVVLAAANYTAALTFCAIWVGAYLFVRIVFVRLFSRARKFISHDGRSQVQLVDVARRLFRQVGRYRGVLVIFLLSAGVAYISLGLLSLGSYDSGPYPSARESSDDRNDDLVQAQPPTPAIWARNYEINISPSERNENRFSVVHNIMIQDSRLAEESVTVERLWVDERYGVVDEILRGQTPVAAPFQLEPNLLYSITIKHEVSTRSKGLFVGEAIVDPPTLWYEYSWPLASTTRGSSMRFWFSKTTVNLSRLPRNTFAGANFEHQSRSYGQLEYVSGVTSSTLDPVQFQQIHSPYHHIGWILKSVLGVSSVGGAFLAVFTLGAPVLAGSIITLARSELLKQLFGYIGGRMKWVGKRTSKDEAQRREVLRKILGSDTAVDEYLRQQRRKKL